MADIERDQVTIYDRLSHVFKRDIHQSAIDNEIVDKKHFRHFMLKEIFETT